MNSIPLVSEATALPTESQPLPIFCFFVGNILCVKKLIRIYKRASVSSLYELRFIEPSSNSSKEKEKRVKEAGKIKLIQLGDLLLGQFCDCLMFFPRSFPYEE